MTALNGASAVIGLPALAEDAEADQKPTDQPRKISDRNSRDLEERGRGDLEEKRRVHWGR